jgi:phosphatidylinositol alpha-1,6-mannosyltransferase
MTFDALAGGESASLTSAKPSSSGAILLLTELFPPAVGGSAVLLHGIYSRLDAADVTVLADGSPDAAPEGDGRMKLRRHPLAWPAWGVASPQGLRRYVGSALMVRRLMPARAGVVHCARALPEGVIALLARRLGGAPYVTWAHGEDIASALTSRELTLLTKAVFHGAAAALANSRNTAQMLQSIGVPERKIHVVHPAVDSARFHPRIDGRAVRQRLAEPDDLVLLSVGRLQRRKGHDAAIEAVAALRDEVPRLRYVIVGDGEERARLEALVDRHGVRDRIVFAGIVGEAELPAYYAACDVFVLPNRIDNGDLEGFGIVFLEAAACGKPVIGGDSGGVPEAVEHEVTGVLVDGTVPQVAAAIRRLADSEEMRRRLGAAGRERARDRFSWQQAAAAVRDLQHQLVAGPA